MQDTTTQSELHSIHSSEDLPSEAPLAGAPSPVTRLWETSSLTSKIAVTVIGTCLLIAILLYVFSRDRLRAEQQQ
jgi:hypothetical protein